MPVSAPTPTLSIVVPTYKEAENLPVLLPKVAAALATRGWVWELIVVDDNSPDATPAVLTQLSTTFPQLRSHIRKTERGLSSAVIAGIQLARHDYIVVMDADLSHPPEAMPALIDTLMQDKADFVIGSRYVSGGATEDWSRLRYLNSWGATMLARPLVGAIKDPMAGYFALRREALRTADPLNPVGYKIALELVTKMRVKPHRVAEVPITFRNRLHGQSKLTFKEQLRYLEHLSRLYDYKFPKAAPRLKFLFVAGCGAVAAAVTLLVLDVFHLPAPVSLACALAAMIVVTLGFFIRYVRAQRGRLAIEEPYTQFACMSFGELITGWAFAVATQAVLFVQLLIGISVLVLVRYALRKIFQHDLRGVRGTPLQQAMVPLTLAPRGGDAAASA